MARIRLKYVHGFRDRHGRLRYYFRRAGFKRIALPGLPGSPEFMRAYESALAGDAEAVQIGANRTKAGSVSALVASWYQSGHFAGLRSTTKSTYRGIAERFRAEHGDKPVALMEPRHIRKIIASKADTPNAANNLLNILRMLMRHAIEEDWIVSDPTIGVRPIRVKSDGFHTWTEDEIAKFEAHHKQGTRARLAFDLLLYTGQRRGDVVRMGWQHIRGQAIDLVQQKTGKVLSIPIHPGLSATLAKAPRDHLTFITTAHGAAFSAAGFGNWFRDVVNEAGLPAHCSAHGLRKAAARRLAEAGCTAHEIAAITGHASIAEVQRYTRAADQSRLAIAAISRVQKSDEA